MNYKRLGENVVEEAAVEYFAGPHAALGGLGYTYVPAPELADERAGPAGVVLETRFRAALADLNPDLPAEALDTAARAVLRPESPSLEENNLAFTRWLTRGYPVEVRTRDGLRGDLVRFVDFDDPANNDWLVTNQFTVREETTSRHERRPDFVVFLNGLPVAVFELKDPTAEDATLDKAWNQLQTYKEQIPSLFNTNGVLVISDGVQARVGSLTAPLERFSPWRMDAEGDDVPDGVPELRTVVEGLFAKPRLLDYLRHFQFWEQDADTGRLIKITAFYHQVRAVERAVEETVSALRPEGDGRAGVVWHTQGSGKSVSMAFYAGIAMQHPDLDAPTLLVLTDRNDLDDQLYQQLAAARDLLPKPVQAKSRAHLRELLSQTGGGIVFSTIQKFGTPGDEQMPTLSERTNVIVLADEAHRSHYEFVEGFARNLRDALPNATFVGFTGTPIEFEDRSTPQVFGEYIDTYSISESVRDEATVPIYYESRLAQLEFSEEMAPLLDAGWEEVTEDQEVAERLKTQRRWKQIEAVVGLKKRLKLVAQDLLDHYDRRTEILEGKAIVVCMSRKICARLYREIVRLRPEWHSPKDEAGLVKVVISGSASDDKELIPHIRSRSQRDLIAQRFKEPVGQAIEEERDPLRMVIVRDMWLTGFDVPSAHTMYVDKPMKGHTLMQAIARVNRRFKDKPSGLVVDYIGLAEHLREAVRTYSGKREAPTLPVEEALAQLRTRLGVVRDLFYGFDYQTYFTGGHAERLSILQGAADHVLGLDPVTDEQGRERDGRERFFDAMAGLNKAAALAVHLEGARDLRDEIGFFQQVQRVLRKSEKDEKGGASRGALDLAIQQLVSAAIKTDGVVDLFEVAGLEKPDLSILSDEFLQKVRAVPHENVQVELLKRLIHDEIRTQRRRNVVQAERFSEALKETLTKYRNRAVETAQVIAELIEMAKGLRDAQRRGEDLDLGDDELAFYDALIVQGDVQEVMGDETLSAIARELTRTVRNSVSIDWRQKESARAQMRARVKRLLRRHGYPPEKREGAVATVIKQAEALSREWAREL